jgi:hypothetical protein
MEKFTANVPTATETSAKPVKDSQRTGPDSEPYLRLQGTIGNQAVLHLLQGRILQAKLAANHPSDAYEQEADHIAEHVVGKPETHLQRACACGNPTMAGGECSDCSKKNRPSLQTKLQVNEPGDIYEQEADRIADHAMAAPTHPALSVPPHIQRFTGQPARQTDGAPASVDHALASSGSPLEPALRQDMEERLGYDFSRVRLHSGSVAEQSARDVNALAYTIGHNIVFGAGRFSPGTDEGRRLIAHELTHVVQQSSADGIGVGSNELRGPAPGLTSGHQPVVNSTVQRMVQRSPDDVPPEGPVEKTESPQTGLKKVAIWINFDKPLTQKEFIEVAETQIFGHLVGLNWTKVRKYYKASDSPREVTVPAYLVQSALREKIAALPSYIQDFLTTDKGTVASYEDLESVLAAGTILEMYGVSADELLLREYQQAEAEDYGGAKPEETDLVTWAEGFASERLQAGEEALKTRRSIVSMRENLDQWSEDEKNGIKNVADGNVDESVMHMLLHRHKLAYYDLVHAFEAELKSITSAFLSQAQVALIRIERTYLADRNVGVEERAIKESIGKIQPAMGERDRAADDLKRIKDHKTFYGALPVLAVGDPDIAAAEAKVKAKDEELRKKSEDAGLAVVGWHGFDWDPIRSGDVEGTRSALRQFVAHAHSQLRSAKKKVESLKTLYKADRMVAMTKAAVGIQEGSVFDDIIRFRVNSEASDGGFWSNLWDIVTIALMFVPGNIGIALRLGAGLIDATKAMDEYAEGMELHKVGMSTEAPSPLGVLLAAGGAFLEVPQMEKGVVKVLGSEAKAVREGEQAIVKVGDESAAKAGKTIEGTGSRDIAAAKSPDVAVTSHEPPVEGLAREKPTEVGPTGKLTTTQASDPKVAEEMNKLGPVDPNTKLLLESDDGLRKALVENELAASALKKCTSPCFPKMDPKQVERLEHILKGLKKTGDYDEALLKQFLADNRDNLDEAIHAITGWSSSKDLDAFLRFAAEGDIEKIASKLDPKLMSEMKRRAHDVGVEYGEKQAIKDGLTKGGVGGVKWENPITAGEFGQGFDDIMVKGGDLDSGLVYIVEYKGGRAGLSPGQMSLEWVKGNIKKLSLYDGPHGREMAEKLARALKEGRLRGVVYSTPVVGLRETKKIGGELIYDAVGVRLPPMPAP